MAMCTPRLSAQVRSLAGSVERPAVQHAISESSGLALQAIDALAGARVAESRPQCRQAGRTFGSVGVVTMPSVVRNPPADEVGGAFQKFTIRLPPGWGGSRTLGHTGFSGSFSRRAPLPAGIK